MSQSVVILLLILLLFVLCFKVSAIEVYVSGNKTTGVAKWAYITKLFEIDSKNARFRTVPKLTEECFNISGTSAMMVGLAAWVMSYSVAAGIGILVSNGKLKSVFKVICDVAA